MIDRVKPYIFLFSWKIHKNGKIDAGYPSFLYSGRIRHGAILQQLKNLAGIRPLNTPLRMRAAYLTGLSGQSNLQRVSKSDGSNPLFFQHWPQCGQLTPQFFQFLWIFHKNWKKDPGYPGFLYSGGIRHGVILQLLKNLAGIRPLNTPLRMQAAYLNGLSGQSNLQRVSESDRANPLFFSKRANFALFEASIASATPPPGGLGPDPYENSRNTYLWNKKAMADDPNDPASAKVYHWLHSTEGTTEQMAPIIENLKNPNESLIWYVYPVG